MESNWICNQLATNMVHLFGKNLGSTEEGQELSIVKEDVMRFLEFMHVQKLDVSTVFLVLLHFRHIFSNASLN